MWHAMQVVEPAVQPSTDPHLPHPKGACHPREACLQGGACLLLREDTPLPEISGSPQWEACHPLPTLQVTFLLPPYNPFLWNVQLCTSLTQCHLSMTCPLCVPRPCISFNTVWMVNSQMP